MESNYGVLSDLTIINEMRNSNIVIYNPDADDKTCQKLIGNCSVNVTLGKYFYRSNETEYLNPFSHNHIKQFWKSEYETASQVTDQELADRLSLKLNDYYIELEPGESILAHTNEFIGGRYNITSMMKARSSMGRCNVTVCRDAGWGDIGYVNRYTMEITNENRKTKIILPVGKEVAQIVFFRTDIPKKEYSGKYQSTTVLDELVQNWKPSLMLPKGYQDQK